MGDFLNITVIGVALSLILEAIQKKYGTDSFAMKMSVLLLSILVGGVYYFLSELAIWQSVLGVLGASSAFYAVFLHRGSSA